MERHDRDSAGMRYIYAVLSRRAGGVSLGINLNTNNACNWACVYCQVPGLTRGGPEPVDLALLERELSCLLAAIAAGDTAAGIESFGGAQVVDVAFSGNGEPTSAPEFAAALDIVARQLAANRLAVPIRLITNGSLLGRARVRAAIETLGGLQGEVWFKVDRAGSSASRSVNGVARSTKRTIADLLRCAALAPTWVQTCWFANAAGAPDDSEVAAYLALLAEVRHAVRGVHLYGLARQSMQPGAEHLRRLDAVELEALAKRIRALNLVVTVSP
ncbi:MAG TPA: radical SAM protein [Rhodocyclaceae bacterium]